MRKLIISTITIIILVGLNTSVLADKSQDIADLDLQSLPDNVVLLDSELEGNFEEVPSNDIIVSRSMISPFINMRTSLGW